MVALDWVRSQRIAHAQPSDVENRPTYVSILVSALVASGESVKVAHDLMQRVSTDSVKVALRAGSSL